jgi:hypothetical protein
MIDEQVLLNYIQDRIAEYRHRVYEDIEDGYTAGRIIHEFILLQYQIELQKTGAEPVP